ncbi:endonuclease, putative [Ricinus communis]|uniref:Crossover junction endonuclease MUS81 n=1 Tax=Ricinus communis TaxID=3988 RepID=B9RGF8_RICCO|nr:endonuclease, putative [Ricinus communis]
MQNQKRVFCPENEELASYMLQKRQVLADSPKGISENLDMTLSKAYSSVCTAKTPIKTLKDLSLIKGVGKWILKLMQGFFDGGPENSEPEDLTNKVKRGKEAKQYMPQKNSVAYALLITLYRGTSNGNEFMRKQELIDAAEASGLSRVPIAPEKGRGKPAQFGSSPRDWYSGWNCMKTLITKGLVVKSSCPAKYMLTEEGRETACECLMRSRLSDPREGSANAEEPFDADMSSALDLDSARLDSAGAVTSSSVAVSGQKKPIDVPLESLQRFLRMGYSKVQVLHAFTEVSETSWNKEISSLWPAVLCRLREDQVYGLHSELQSFRKDCQFTTTAYTYTNGIVDFVDHQSVTDLTSDGGETSNSCSVRSAHDSFSLRACSSSVCVHLNGLEANLNTLSMPPLSLGERFEDVYEVVLVLDDREQFAVQGSKCSKLIENICKEHKIKIVVRRLPVGDGIWIARHKYLHSEYVLDFIVERKKVEDLRSSIRDHRYKDQKLRLLRCGLRKLIYLVEGDPNFCEAAESIKTACFTTEILEGFDVQRTSCLRDTLKKYGYLTHSITQYYSSQLLADQPKCNEVCPSFDEFIKRCQDLEKMTISDVFAIQLMQVPQVTEEIAIAVLDLYPTLISLACAYSLLDGDVCAQEEMLRKHSNNAISATASRNIFRLVWGNDN